MIDRFKKLVRTNKSLSLISSGVASFLGLLTFGLLARSLSGSELGFWVLFMTVFTLFDMLRSGLVGNALIKKVNEVNDDEGEATIITGSAWRLSVRITLISSFIISFAFFIAYYFTKDVSFKYIFLWFTPIAILSLPHSISNWISNAYVRFTQILWTRFVLQFGFLIGVVLQYFFEWGLSFVLIAYLFSNFCACLLVIIKGWSKVRTIRKGQRKVEKSIFHFGKYTMGSMIASNLLKSSDTFLILFFMGPNAVALYNIPTKLVGLFDIPLRAFISISFPQLAKKYSVGMFKEFKDEFETDIGFSTLLLLPINILAFIFAEPLVVMLGGQDYSSSADILRVFCIYTALTPLDRFAGIALDVINRPDLNFIKVLTMLLANIVGDILVLHYTGSMLWVAFVSTITFLTGIVFGFIFLRKDIPFRPGFMFKKGAVEYSRLVKKYVGNS